MLEACAQLVWHTQAFEFAVRDHFEECDFIQGIYSPCVYRHKTKRMWFFVHCDDYVGLGLRNDLLGFLAQLKARFLVKNRGTLGPGPDDVRQTRISNRVLTWVLPSASSPEMIT